MTNHSTYISVEGINQFH